MYRNFDKILNIFTIIGRILFAPQHGMVECWENGKLGLKSEKAFL